MEADLLVNKILYHNTKTAYIVFEGITLRWSKRKLQYLPTKEKNVYVGFFYCLFPGDRVKANVEPSYNKLYGSQFVISSGRREEPASESEIRSFLTRNIKGMTPKRLERLMDAYGLSVLDTIKRDPHALDFLGLDSRITQSLYDQLSRNTHFEEVVVFLESMTIDCRLASPLFEQYGANTTVFLKDNPYAAYEDKIFSYKNADLVYGKLGKPPRSDLRCYYTTLETLRVNSQSSGNVYTLRNGLEKLVNHTAAADNEPVFTDGDVQTALDDLMKRGLVVTDTSFGHEAVYLKENYIDEKSIVRCLKGLHEEPKKYVYSETQIEAFLKKYENRTGIHLAENQKKAVKMALSSPISIISGGPGTGKTQTVNTIVTAIRALSAGANMRACAPTGKAAMRLAELTGLKACTIHRLIGYGRFDDGFLQHGDLQCDFLFVDEFSMVDIHLCALLLDAVSPNARIIMIGDSNQLPSVGPGLVLRDFIASHTIPTVFLDQIFRQALNSNIVVNSHRVIHQEPDKPIYLRRSHKPGRDFYYMEEDDPRKIERLIQRSIAKLQNIYHMGIDSIQILSPVHGGPLGTEHLNLVIQNQVNPNALAVTFEDKEFRLGDKVIHTVNDYDLEVFNGEVGIISDISFAKQKALTVAYPDRDVDYAYKDLKELELAYALTIHKMQGSEQSVVLLPVHESIMYGLSKNSIYTALTRAKKMVILIGSRRAVSVALRREGISGRASDLIERLQRTLPCLTNEKILPKEGDTP